MPPPNAASGPAPLDDAPTQADRLRILPAHIEDSVAANAYVDAEHYRRAGPVHRVVANTMARLAKPGLLLVLTVVIVGWVVLNLVLGAAGARAPDPPPFNYLATAVSVAALLLASMILITQRHDDELATRRDQLTLELAILSEKKSAKIIELLEAERKRDPTRRHERDPDAERMADPTDPRLVLEAIKATTSPSATAKRPPPPERSHPVNESSSATKLAQ